VFSLWKTQGGKKNIGLHSKARLGWLLHDFFFQEKDHYIFEKIKKKKLEETFQFFFFKKNTSFLKSTRLKLAPVQVVPHLFGV